MGRKKQEPTFIKSIRVKSYEIEEVPSWALN